MFEELDLKIAGEATLGGDSVSMQSNGCSGGCPWTPLGGFTDCCHPPL